MLSEKNITAYITVIITVIITTTTTCQIGVFFFRTGTEKELNSSTDAEKDL